MTSEADPKGDRVREKRARSFLWQTVQRFKRWRSSRRRARWVRLNGLPTGQIGRGSKGR